MMQDVQPTPFDFWPDAPRSASRRRWKKLEQLIVSRGLDGSARIFSRADGVMSFLMALSLIGGKVRGKWLTCADGLPTTDSDIGMNDMDE